MKCREYLAQPGYSSRPHPELAHLPTVSEQAHEIGLDPLWKRLCILNENRIGTHTRRVKEAIHIRLQHDIENRRFHN